MEKINILFLYSSKGFGGMVQNLSLLIQNLDPRRFNIHVVVLGNAGDEDSNLKIPDRAAAHFWRIDEEGAWDRNALKTISDIIIKNNIDILSCHGYKADFYGFIVVRFFGCAVKRVTMTHGWVTPGWKMELYYLLDKLVMRDFDKVILVEATMAPQLGPCFPKRKLAVIENGVDTDYFKLAPSEGGGHPSIDRHSKTKVLGFVGRLSPEKGVETILLAMGEVVRTHPNVHLHIVGTGPEETHLRHVADELKLDGNVSFLGYRSDTRKEYGVMDIYISASTREGLPNSVLEAQASGIPCIVSDIPGNRRVVTGGVNGLVFQMDDPKDLAAKIRWMLTHSEKAYEYGQTGQERVVAEFSLKKRIQKLEDLYRSLAGQGLRSVSAEVQ